MAMKPRTFHLPYLALEAQAEAEPENPLKLTSGTRRAGNMSSLQLEYNSIVKRVVGKNNPYYSPASSSSSCTCSASSTPEIISPSSDTTPPSTPSSSDDDDDEVLSNYDKDENEDDECPIQLDVHTTHLPTEDSTAQTSLSTPSSYASFASLNPYILDAEDLAWRLSLIEPEPSAREDLGYGEDYCSEDRARLERQLDRAHASVKAEERVALGVLRRLSQLS